MSNEETLKALVADKIKLQSTHKNVLSLILICVWLTGVLWLILEYYLTSQGEFGIQHNPLQSTMLKAHGGFGFLTLFIFGTMLAHMRRGLAVKRNVISGIFFIFIFIVLGVTGWGLYYLGEPKIREWTSLIHWIIGLLLPLVLFVHPKLGRLTNRSSE